MGLVTLPRLVCITRRTFHCFCQRNCTSGSKLKKEDHLELDNLGKDGISIFNAAVTAVLPHTMVKGVLQLNEDQLKVGQRSYRLNHNVHILAFGKAVGGMVRAVEDILGHHIVGGVASVPQGISDSLRAMGKDDLLPITESKVAMMEGAADNIPDECAARAAHSILNYAKSLSKHDLLLTLVSGGGSALLPSPIPPVTLTDMAQVTRTLSRRGATIQQLNSVRIHIEQLKGGGLAQAANPAQVVSLILSDVIDDDLNLIACGPTVPNHVPITECFNLINDLGVKSNIPQNVLSILNKKHSEPLQEKHEEDFSHVQNILVGTNIMALQAAEDMARQLDYLPLILSSSACGDARKLGNLLSKLPLLLQQENSDFTNNLESLCENSGLQFDKIVELNMLLQNAHKNKRGVCVLIGGETTVHVCGDGKGGRNQEMALAAAMHMEELKLAEKLSDWDLCFLSGGTDGQDGPTDVAGAVINQRLISVAQESGLDPAQYLANNDSYNFFRIFRQGTHHIRTGFTGTNVMDVQVLLLKSKIH